MRHWLHRCFHLALVVGLLALGGCGSESSGRRIPADVLSDEAVGVLHIDTTRVDEASIEAMTNLIVGPFEKANADRAAENIERNLGRFGNSLSDFKDAGGKGMLVLIGPPMGTRGPRGGPSVAFLFELGPEADNEEAFEAAADMLPIGPASMNSMEEWADQGERTWFVLEPDNDDGPNSNLFQPDGTDQEIAQRVNRLLGKAGDKTVRLAFLPSRDAAEQILPHVVSNAMLPAPPEERRRVFREVEDMDLPSFALMTMGDGMAFGFQPGEQPDAKFSVVCNNETSATRMARILDGGLLLGRAALAGAASEVEAELEPAKLDEIEQAFRFQQDGAEVAMTVGPQQLDKLREPLTAFLASGQSRAMRQQNTANVRSIVHALNIYGQEHDDQYPQGDTPGERYEKLLNGGYVTPEMLINPIDDGKTPARKGPDGDYHVTPRNYSYALLVPDSPEWGFTMNSQAPLVADRNTGTADDPASVWSPDGSWKGSVGWGDGHASFEDDAQLDTVVDNRRIENDHLLRHEARRASSATDDIRLGYGPSGNLVSQSGSDAAEGAAEAAGMAIEDAAEDATGGPAGGTGPGGGAGGTSGPSAAEQLKQEKKQYQQTVAKAQDAAAKGAWPQARKMAKAALNDYDNVTADNPAMRSLVDRADTEMAFTAAQQKARQALKSEQWQQAITAAKKAAEQKPDAAFPHELIARAHQQQYQQLYNQAQRRQSAGELAGAIQSYNQALDVDTDTSDAEQALKNLRQSNKRNPIVFRKMREMRFVPADLRVSYAHLAVPPDGSKVFAVVGRREGLSKFSMIRTLNLSTGERPVWHQMQGFMHDPAVSADGRWLVLARNDQLWTYSLSQRSPSLGWQVKPLKKMSDEARKRGVREGGMLVGSTLPGSAARKAGLRKGDMIVSVNGKPAATPQSWRNAYKTGQPVNLVVAKDGNRRDVKLTPLSKPNAVDRRKINGLRSLAFSRDGSQLFIGTSSSKMPIATIRMRDQELDSNLSRQLSAVYRSTSKENPAFPIAVHPKKNLILAGPEQIHGVSEQSGSFTLPGHIDDAKVTTLGFNSSGDVLASGAQDNKVLLWNIPGRKLMRSIEHPGNGRDEDVYISGVAFTAGGQRVLTASTAGPNVRIWDAKSGEAVGMLKGHKKKIYDMAMYADGRRLVTAGADGKVIVWGVGENVVPDVAPHTKLARKPDATNGNRSKPTDAQAARPGGGGSAADTNAPQTEAGSSGGTGREQAPQARAAVTRTGGGSGAGADAGGADGGGSGLAGGQQAAEAGGGSSNAADSPRSPGSGGAGSGEAGQSGGSGESSARQRAPQQNRNQNQAIFLKVKSPRAVTVAVAQSGYQSQLIDSNQKQRVAGGAAGSLLAGNKQAIRVRNKHGDVLAKLTPPENLSAGQTLLLTETGAEKKTIGSTEIITPGEWSIAIAQGNGKG